MYIHTCMYDRHCCNIVYSNKATVFTFAPTHPNLFQFVQKSLDLFIKIHQQFGVNFKL